MPAFSSTCSTRRGELARKNLLTNVMEPDASEEGVARPNATRYGASRSMRLSIDELAESTKRMLAGETVVSLDTALIDGSFVSDRIGGADEDFDALRTAIGEHGQTTPILVRPHPEAEGRYMIVFGHRRTRAARDLGVPVRAVVKNIADIAHVVAQGQENTARANLSFIEKALFGKKLLDMGQGKETIKAALTVDDTLLSRMLSVADTISPAVIEAIGAAKGVGRDRWEELKRLVLEPAAAAAASGFVASGEFPAADAAERFNALLQHLKTRRAPARRRLARPTTWVADDKMVSADFRRVGKTFSLSLKSKDANGFGEYLSTNLGTLYQAFKASKGETTNGD